MLPRSAACGFRDDSDAKIEPVCLFVARLCYRVLMQISVVSYLVTMFENRFHRLGIALNAPRGNKNV
jgi:hypothetical protein